MCKFISTTCLIAVWFVVSSQTFAQVKVNKRAKNITSQVSIVQVPNHLLCVGLVDLGDIDVDTTYQVNLTILNSLPEGIVFDKVDTGCKCAKFSMDTSEIKPGVKNIALAEFKTPKSSEDGGCQFFADLYYGSDKHVLRLKFVGKLIGNLHLQSKNAVFRVDESHSQWRVPVSISEPILAKNLEVKLSDNMNDFEWQVISSNDQPNQLHVELGITREMFKSEFLFGKLTVVDKASETSVESEMVFARREPITCSPRVLRFKGESNQSAHVLLEFSPELLTKDPDRLPRITCLVKEKPKDIAVLDDFPSEKKIEPKIIVSKIQRLNSRIYRVAFCVDENEKADLQDRVVDVGISVDGKTFTLSIPFLELEK
jgi:hypothetical protein